MIVNPEGNGYELTGTKESDPEAGIPAAPPTSPSRSASKVKRQDIRWSNVSFEVKGKKILDSCWGYVPNGKLCAIMGPSG
jgi:hypothetical protein